MHGLDGLEVHVDVLWHRVRADIVADREPNSNAIGGGSPATSAPTANPTTVP